jgi:hypothetical protein
MFPRPESTTSSHEFKMDASEPSTLTPSTPTPAQPTNTSRVPLLGEGFQESTSRQVSRSAGSDTSDVDLEGGEITTGGTKAGKRRLFGFGKKKKNDDKTEGARVDDSGHSIAANGDIPIAQPTAKRIPAATPISPSRANYPYRSPSSPQRNLYSSSPRVVSPAGSQIFERDVQESALPVPASPAIPSHIQRENHIPPVLDASSEAITNNTLDPDTVEIVMHSSHQPAAVTVTGVGGGDATAGTWTDDLIAHPDRDDAASNYGALDSADVRRLSFISFSDIVQSEHNDHAGSRDSIYVAGLSSLSSGHNRSPSPIRSPISSSGVGTSPPTSKSASVKGVDLSPRTRPLGSPTLAYPTPSGGELTIETMRQALRRTESGDLSGVRSQPLSPTSPDGLSDRSFR